MIFFVDIICCFQIFQNLQVEKVQQMAIKMKGYIVDIVL